MKSYTFNTQGVCAKAISFSIDDNGALHDVKFMGGCPGNTSAISKLIEGEPAEKISSLLKGNECGNRGTSCADQLAIAINQAFAENTVINK